MPHISEIYLRASVASVCNMNCGYCPKVGGMENRVPAHLAGAHLSAEEYIAALRRLAALGLRKVSFTGGEPTLNVALPQIIAAARELFDVVELTSNGRHLARMLPTIGAKLDLLKISLDTLDPGLFAEITATGPQEHAHVMTAVELAANTVPKLGINFVYMRKNQSHIWKMIEYVADLNRRSPATVHLSILDFYYSDERAKEWSEQYVPISDLQRLLSDRFEIKEGYDRFGCRFSWFDAGTTQIRLKDSASGTMRNKICDDCRHYCQEGLYGLKLSTVGWVTPCPVNDPNLGGHISSCASGAIPMVNHVLTAQYDPVSFQKMILRNAALKNTGHQ